MLLPQKMPSQAIPQVGQPCHGDGYVQDSNLEDQHTESFRPWDTTFCPWQAFDSIDLDAMMKA